MSRYYTVEVEIEDVTDAEARVFKQNVLDLGLINEDSWRTEEGNYTVWGNITLAGGMSEQEMHLEFVQLYKDKKIASRWRYEEDRPWDQEFFHDPDDEEDEDYW